MFRLHLDGINRSWVGKREAIGAATVERHFRHGLKRQFAAWHSPKCPPILGIDEHFFTRRQGFATTLCDLKNHTVYDVVLGRSEASLAAYFAKLEGKDQVRIVCIDLSSTDRALVEREFPNARIVADRFHIIRVVNHHFLACWREIDPVGSKHRGLISLMRRHRRNLKPNTAPVVNVFHSPPACSPPSSTRGRRRCVIWRSSEKLSIPGKKKLPGSGASPGTTESPRASTTKWRPSAGRRTGSATSKTTDSE